jgi:hypothetical protein
MKSFLVTCWLAFAAQIAAAACPTWPTAERFTFDGSEVIDKRTGLVWARCAVGQSWSGSACTGIATSMDHEAALTHAQRQNGWRLPHVKELASLADKGCGIPSIDSPAFPNAPLGNHWSSTSTVGDAGKAWNVGFGFGGYVDYGSRDSFYLVRLVRAR